VKLTTGKLFSLIATMLMLVSVSMVSVPVQASPTVFTPATATLLASGLNYPWGLGVFTGSSVLVNTGDNNLWRYLGGSKYLVLTSTHGLTASRMSGLSYVTGDDRGNIYMLSGKSLKLLTSIKDGDIFGLDIDKNGDVYFIDDDHQVLYRLPRGSIVAVTVATLPFESYGVAVKGNTLYVSDFDGGNIYTLPKTGGSLTLFASGLDLPEDIVFDRMGNLYTSEWYGNIAFIRAGSKAIKIIATGFENPLGLGIDMAGYLYFTDYGAGKLWMFKPY
jgi:hypothetical protein